MSRSEFEDARSGIIDTHRRDMRALGEQNNDNAATLILARNAGLIAAYRITNGQYKSVDEKRKLENQVKEGKKAVDVLIISNYKIVFSLAIRFWKKVWGVVSGINADYPDLLQAGYLGLIKAAQTYDTKKGVKFSTWAYFLINQYISFEITASKTIVNTRVAYEDAQAFNNVTERLYQSLGRTPLPEEIRKKMGVSKEKFNRIRFSQQIFAYLYFFSRINEDPDDNPIAETIASDLFPNVENSVLTNLTKLKVYRLLDSLISNLPTLEKDMLIYHFGLKDGMPKSLRQTGKKFKLKSRQSVAYHIQKALEILGSCLELQANKEVLEV